MKFYDTDTHEIFEATAKEFRDTLELYQVRQLRNTLIYGCGLSIFLLEGPVLKGHRHWVHKLNEEYVMIKFEDKFVHFRWTDELIGKKCFVADNMDELQEAFGAKTFRIVSSFQNETFPFQADGTPFRFAYYDPNYDCKVAFNEGKTIQIKSLAGTWKDTDKPIWLEDSEYRIKPQDYAVIIASGELVYVPENCAVAQKIFFRGTQDACHNYIVEHEKFKECMVAWAEGKQIQLQLYSGEWRDISDPNWAVNTEYRMKPTLKWTDLKIGDVIQRGDRTAMVTVIDKDDKCARIYACDWLADEDLEEWHKV